MTYTLDAGALIALERGHPRMLDVVRAGRPLSIPATALAQVWRGRRQARLNAFLQLPHVEVVPLGRPEARAVGAMLAISGTSDVVDAHVVLTATLRQRAVVTSDPDDLLRLDPRLELLVV